MDDLTDAQLVPLAAHPGPHREAAFEALVRRHAGRVHRLAAGTVGPGAADDVVQEVMISVYRNLAGFRAEAQFSTWLHRVTLNACHKALAARLTIPLEDAPEPLAPHSPVRAGEQADLRGRLAWAMAQLPPEQRDAVTLRELGGLDYAEIAEVLGVELGTVKSRLGRGRAALRALLSGIGVTP
ncbi:sigma-70 family RNA polymerase sigma factor [Deinococcus metallilatus]|uniref:RNA polymerase sigma factor n=1 Tax=Deinococcus metallilatus TaxID=1211322 RepID=A0AAJ5F5N4_9DEIO|nr:sigma-70 family RNA polymerase sigma factor [Deinococcus metallilatus]MBB5294411.1 RNA polymerase sigma-70 factor (ECF subfamily) [Deinococcus metallilatus]QBY10164.1 sigma-70 family RNA polymerase sigma factor [Deinococcus metallilatus]RXJ13890.1 sigma-70 family RNA polymerase sigma factor [Deinococcus metallilatus]TLK29856.1 sigma-70 family RNA polymerase sigma factor [Deinococcus metallilatus]GMA15627.1 RNA polymerase sigma factor SigM [Deinococcus metallilatus]